MYYFSDYTTRDKLFELAKLSARRKVLLDHLLATEKFSSTDLEVLSCGITPDIIEIGTIIQKLMME